MHPAGPFSIPAIRNFVPERLKPWIIILFVICFQFSGGVYLAAVSEMVGSLALMQEDIMMAGYASMVGMALTFTVMFRLKFCFTSKTSLLVCAAVIIVCNLVCMHTANVPLLVFMSFAAGIFRMWATFECNSTIQLWLTPKRDMAVFFCYVYLLVQGCIQLSGLTAVYVSFFSEWEYMHWLIVGLLMTVMLATVLLFNNKRFVRKLPLYGIDWLGALLWGGTVLAVIFVCVYGEHYDWWDSQWIVSATVAAAVMLGLNLWRASFIRHPFIALETWRYRVVWLTLSIYLVFDLLLAPAHLLEHVYMETVLGYDALHVVSLNWAVFLGTIVGALFAYCFFALRKWSYQTMTVIAFTAVTLYLMICYFTVDYDLPKESLLIPVFLRGFAYVVLAACFLTVLTRVPFAYFFQAIMIQGFVSAGIGSVFATAVLGCALNVLCGKNAMLLGASVDRVNPSVSVQHYGEIYGAVQQQAFMVTMKELYGWLTLLGILCLLLFLVKKSDLRPQYVIHPTYKAVRRMLGRTME